MADIKAISTSYKGYLFRSRLEARWAVFFDALGLEWEYEPEGFLLADGTKYLPDFYLRGLDAWIEVKPTVKDTDLNIMLMFKKAKLLADMMQKSENTNAIESHVYLAFGVPGLAKIETCGDWWGIKDGSVLIPVYKSHNQFCVEAFAMTNGGSGLDIWPVYTHKNGHNCASPVFPRGFVQRIYVGKGVEYNSPNLKKAYSAARSARFEYGERA